ncbi:hypothetical protein AVEN_102368-1, partial [Araneus ventricosus]
MSSVSLVVRPPANTTKNRTSGSGRLDRDEHPYRHTLPVRKEQPSYRFLDEGVVGEGSVHLEPDSVEEENSSGSISGSFSSESQVVEGSIHLKKSSMEYLSETRPPDVMKSNSAPENLELKESSVEYVETKPKSDFSEDNSRETTVLETTTKGTLLTESSVEYLSSEINEERTSPDVYTTHTENNKNSSESKELTNPGSDVTESVLVLNRSEDYSWTSYLTTEFSTNFNESINNVSSPDSEESFNKSSDSSNEMGHKSENLLSIYSAKSDIGFNYQNRSNTETNTSLEEYDDSSVNDESDSEEITSKEEETTSAILYTKYMSTENIITENLPDLVSEHKNASVASSTSIPSLFRNEESLEETTEYFDTSNATTESELSTDISSSVNDEFSVPTELDVESETFANTSDSQTHSVNLHSKDLNPNHITMHSQQGHGFHKPLQKPSSAKNSSTTHSTELPPSTHEIDIESKAASVSDNPTEPSTTSSNTDKFQNATYSVTFLDEEEFQTIETSSFPAPSSFQTTGIPQTTGEELSTLGSHLSEAATNDSFVPKIVPQQSDLSFDENAIESGDDLSDWTDDDLLDQDRRTEIIRHITTLPPTPVSLGKHPVFISQKCAEDEFQCESGECVDLSGRCNMRRDCRDNSDEKNC